MPPPKPRNAPLKDSVVAYLTLKAHFAIADNYPKDTNCNHLGKLMLVQQQNPSGEHGAPTFVGQYYNACKLFADQNSDKMKQNYFSLGSILKLQHSSYWTHRTRLRALYSEKLAGAGAGGPAPH